MRIILDNIDRNKTYKKETVYQYFKRLVDISVSIALIIILFSIFLLITIFIKLEDGGKVIFAHSRIGYKGKKLKYINFEV